MKRNSKPGAKCADVLMELIKREPIFHRPEFGTTRADFERMTDEAFWEIGASGRCYSREQVLSGVTRRYEDPNYRGMGFAPEDTWTTHDFQCREITSKHYLLTYTLNQGSRITRRTTIWRRAGTGWKVLFHQGTIVEDSLR